MKSVAVLGLGKLGLVWALVLASKGYKVHGVDISHTVVSALKKHILPISENGLEELYDQSKSNFKAYDSVSELPNDIEQIFIIVPTPSLSNHKFDSSYVEACFDELIPAYLNKQFSGYKDIIITSTVMPGTCEKLEKKLENSLAPNIKCSLLYNPEFIALGSVINDMLNPDFILIGSSDTEAIERLSAIYKEVNGNQVIIRAMSLVSAEITKISINTFLTMKISYANLIGLISESFEGANAFDIAEAVGSDKRIGNKYLKPGLGFGGPCLPRDTRAFGKMLYECGIPSDISDASRNMNRYMLQNKLSRIDQEVDMAKASNKILIIGIAYKSGSWLLEDSHEFQILKELNKKQNNTIYVFDYCAEDIKRFAKELSQVSNNVILSSDIRNTLYDNEPNVIIYQSQLNEKEMLMVEDYKEKTKQIVSEVYLNEPANSSEKRLKQKQLASSDNICEISQLSKNAFENLLNWFQNAVECDLEKCHELPISSENIESYLEKRIRQKYKQSRDEFQKIYQQIIHEIYTKYQKSEKNAFKERIIVQSFPNIYFQLPNKLPSGKHKQNIKNFNIADEIYTFIALTETFQSSSLYVEKNFTGELNLFSRYEPLLLEKGQYARLKASANVRGNLENLTGQSRVSIDFGIVQNPSSLSGEDTEVGNKKLSLGSHYSLFDTSEKKFIS